MGTLVPIFRAWRGPAAALFLGLLLAAGCSRSAGTPSSPAAAMSEDETAVRGLLQHYFQSWSARDMAAYGACFHPNAQIWYADQPPLPLQPFLQQQTQAHLDSPVPMTEVPLSLDVAIHNGLAHAQVHWELRQGDKIVRGYDFYTLVKADGRWQILALVFNEESS